MTTMRIVVDHSKCTGLGICESIAEDVFQVGDDGSLVVLMEDISADRREQLQQAVDSCPTEAIQLVD
jgi:ferredoxin